jgi:Fic family protein
MRKFDYSFLLNYAIPNSIVPLLFNLARLQTLAGSFQVAYPQVFENLQKIARVQSVKGSNAIEGICTTDERIKSLVNDNTEPRNHNEKEIVGYRDALNEIHNKYQSLDIKQNDILALHNIMLTPNDSPYKGKYKNVDNVIMETHIDGTRRVHFTPVSAKETPFAMEQLELAFYAGRQESSINYLLLVPCYILDFLCIHPFNDGNGRISRLLSLLLLYHGGYDIGKYVSFENIINQNKEAYYEALKQSSLGWETNENTYWPFVENFLITLVKCYNELDRRYEIVNNKKLSKAERIKETILQTLGPISKEELHNIWPDISFNTIEAELNKLCKEEIIAKIGKTKGVKYQRL